MDEQLPQPVTVTTVKPLIIDEFSDMTDDAWERLSHELGTVRKGSVCISTPRDDRDELYSAFWSMLYGPDSVRMKDGRPEIIPR
jgi:hypothetical protein